MWAVGCVKRAQETSQTAFLLIICSDTDSGMMCSNMSYDCVVIFCVMPPTKQFEKLV